MTNKKFILPALAVVCVLSIGAALYLYKEVSTLKENPQAAAQKEVSDLVQVIGKLIVLPEGETPTVATVSEPERLKDQPFFAKAKAGDKVLLYSTARKAYLYDPVANKLLEVAPLNIGTENASAPAQ